MHAAYKVAVADSSWAIQ